MSDQRTHTTVIEIQECKFYPPAAKDAESRLRFHAEPFPRATGSKQLWAERNTPAGFSLRLVSGFAHVALVVLGRQHRPAQPSIGAE